MSNEMIKVEARKQLLEVEVLEFENSQRFAKAYISSPMIPQHLRDVGSMMIINQMSKDLKLPALGIAQSIYIIKGHIGMSGELIISLLNNSGIFDSRMRWEIENEGKPNWRVRAYNSIDGEVYESEWMDDNFVTKQGWKSNPKWTEMPIQMAKYRTAKRFASLYASEVTMGSVEIEDMQDAGFALDAGTKEETQDINSAIVAGALEVEAKEAVIIEEVGDHKEVTIAGDIEEPIEVDHSEDRSRMPSVIAKLFPLFEKGGMESRHWKNFIGFVYPAWKTDTMEDVRYTVDEFNSIEMEGMNGIKNMVQSYYARCGLVMPEHEAEDEAQEPIEVEDMPVVEEAVAAPTEAASEPYFTPSEVVIHYGEMIGAGVKRPDLVKFCRQFNLTGENIDESMATIEGLVEAFYAV